MGLIPRKQFHRRIFLGVIGVVLISVILFSAVLYFRLRDTMQEERAAYSRNMLSQIQSNMQSIDNSVENYLLSLYRDSSILFIMQSRDMEKDMPSIIINMNEIRQRTIVTNPFVYSVAIYNAYEDTFYSSEIGLLFEDTSLEDLLKRNNYLPPAMTPFYRQIQLGNGTRKDVLTYFFYETVTPENKMDGAIVVNVQLDWLMDNIHYLNTGSGDSSRLLLMLDGRLVGSDLSEEATDDLAAFITEQLTDSNQGEYRPVRLPDGEYYVTYGPISNSDMTLVMLQPRNEAEAYIQQLQVTILLVSAVFVIVALLVSFPVAGNIYRPVNNLMNQVASAPAPDGNSSEYRNELGYLNDLYERNAAILSRYEEENRSYHRQFKDSWLFNLLCDSAQVDRQELEDTCEEYSLYLLHPGDFVICVLALDSFHVSESQLLPADREMIKYALINVAEEVVGDRYPGDGVKIQGEPAIALIVKVPAGEEYEVSLCEALDQIQQAFRRYFDYSLTISVSESCSDIRGLTSLYNTARQNIAYRFVFGQGTIITTGRIAQQVTGHSLSSVFRMENSLRETMMNGNADAFVQALDKLLDELVHLPIRDIRIGQRHLLATLNSLLDEYNKNSLQPVYVNFENMETGLNEMETCEDFRKQLLDRYQEIIGGDRRVNARHAVLVQTVQDLVEEKYADPDLCLNEIADMTRVSSRHLNRMFKDIKGQSISEYITHVRLTKAAQLLETTDLSVNDISLRVGISNPTYFYSLFRKKYGVSPKTYAISSALHNIQRPED